MTYSYFLMQNRHLSEWACICILGNLEKKKAELKEYICMQFLTRFVCNLSTQESRQESNVVG